MARRNRNDARIKFQFLGDLQSLLNALARGKREEFSRLGAVIRLRKQRVLARAELSRSSDNAQLGRILNQLEGRLERLESPVTGDLQARSPFRWWSGARLAEGLAVLALASVVLFPDTAGAIFWSVPLLHYQVAGLPTVLCGLLMAVILWRYLSAPGRPPNTGDPDGLVQFLGEKAILQLSVLAVLLVFFYGKVETLYPFPNVVAYYTHAKFPEFDAGPKNTLPHRVQLATLLLLFCLAASGTSIRHAARWRSAAIDIRRRVALRNAANLAGS